DYTALGENINLASRMEGLNKYLGTDILITEDTKEGLNNNFLTRRLGKFRLKGFAKTVNVYELLGTSEIATETKPWRDAFAVALDHFQKRNFDVARTEFCRVLQLKPEDGPSKFFLRYIEDLPEEVHSPGWQGETELREK